MENETGPEISKVVSRLSRSSKIPEQNILFYLHVYWKMQDAYAASKSDSEVYADINVKFVEVLNTAVHWTWITETEKTLLSRLWLHFLWKPENSQRFAAPVVDNFLTGDPFGKRTSVRKGRRPNPAVDFLVSALKSDSVHFGGKPGYKHIAEFFNHALDFSGYDEETLKGKKKPHYLLNDVISFYFHYYKARGQSLLPDVIPENPEGYIKGLLQMFNIVPAEYPDGGITLPWVRRKG